MQKEKISIKCQVTKSAYDRISAIAEEYDSTLANICKTWIMEGVMRAENNIAGLKMVSKFGEQYKPIIEAMEKEIRNG